MACATFFRYAGRKRAHRETMEPSTAEIINPYLDAAVVLG
jgi:hypothetical protein